MSQKEEEIKVNNDLKDDDDDDEEIGDFNLDEVDQKDNEEEDNKVSDVVFKQNTEAQDLWNKKVLNQRAERHPLAHPKGGYIMNDKDHVVRRGLKIILKSVGSKLIKGQFLDILKFSKPSVLSFPLSYVQAIIRDFQYMPKFLFQASKQSDPFQRLKLLTTSIVAGYHAAVQILGVRGFLNPILGQTFNAKCPQYGTQIFVQQTSHHPPITHYSIISQNFQVNGYGEIWAGLNGMNSVKGGRRGRMVIKVKDSEDPNKFNMYTVLDPEIKIKNLVMGQKTFLFTKGSSIKDHNNKLEADILLKPKEKGKMSKMFGAVTGLFKSKKKAPDPFQILKKKGEDSFLVQISQQALNGKQKKCLMRGHGSWLEGVWFDEKEYWNIGDQPQKFIQNQEQKIMPSDSCKRKDLQFMLQNNYPEAQKQPFLAKNLLETQQRKDKAERVKSQKLRKKAAKK